MEFNSNIIVDQMMKNKVIYDDLFEYKASHSTLNAI